MSLVSIIEVARVCLLILSTLPRRCTHFDQIWHDNGGPPWGGFRNLNSLTQKFGTPLQNSVSSIPLEPFVQA
jgi:hypothetical protein